MEASIEFVCPTCDAKPGESCRSVAPRSIRNRTKYSAPKVIKKLHADRMARCYRAPMASKTACGRSGADSERWNDVQCAACLARQPEIALTYAHYCGTEFEANLENSRMRDYFDDCAEQWGFDDWRALPNDKQLLVRKAFDEGRAAERAARLCRSAAPNATFVRVPATAAQFAEALGRKALGDEPGIGRDALIAALADAGIKVKSRSPIVRPCLNCKQQVTLPYDECRGYHRAICACGTHCTTGHGAA